LRSNKEYVASAATISGLEKRMMTVRREGGAGEDAKAGIIICIDELQKNNRHISSRLYQQLISEIKNN